MILSLLTVILFVMLAATAIAIANLRTMFGVIILTGVFSLLTALLFVIMDAVDVAFTEAAVGAGISTFLMLGTLALIGQEAKPPREKGILPFLLVCLTGAALIYGTWELPALGEGDAPANAHIRPEYIARTVTEIDVPNVVTAILASYRGFDTLGETAVVFTAGIGVLLLLGGLAPWRRLRKNHGSDDGKQRVEGDV